MTWGHALFGTFSDKSLLLPCSTLLWSSADYIVGYRQFPDQLVHWADRLSVFVDKMAEQMWARPHCTSGWVLAIGCKVKQRYAVPCKIACKLRYEQREQVALWAVQTSRAMSSANKSCYKQHEHVALRAARIQAARGVVKGAQACWRILYSNQHEISYSSALCCGLYPRPSLLLRFVVKPCSLVRMAQFAACRGTSAFRAWYVTATRVSSMLHAMAHMHADNSRAWNKPAVEYPPHWVDFFCVWSCPVKSLCVLTFWQNIPYKLKLPLK